MKTQKRVRAADVMYTHQVSDGPARGWVHTHGLADVGLPELEMRGVSLVLGSAAAKLLEDIAEYMLNEPKPIRAGHTMGLGLARFRFEEGVADDANGFDTNHFDDVTRLSVVELEPAAYGCYVCEAETGSCRCHADNSRSVMNE
jgi:hypothetical protein